MFEKPVIFLDIDGVFTSSRIQRAYGDRGLWSRFDPVAVEFFNRISKDVIFVISSTWRKDYNTRDEFQEFVFDHNGFDGILHDDWRTTTDYLGIGKKRGDEVDEWLSRHPEITKFICVDDGSDFLSHQKLVKTDAVNGLMFEEMQEIFDFLY